VSQRSSETPLTSKAESAIELTDVTVAFGGMRALDGVTAEFERGKISGIVGPNGAGKTTLINAVSGLVPLKRGTVTVSGEDITGLAPHRRFRLVGRTFQTCQLVEELGVIENVLIGRTALMKHGLFRSLLPWGLSVREEAEHRSRAIELTAFVGLDSSIDQPIAELTLGQQRLVEIARALASEPDVLLLDEPTAGLSLSEKTDVSTIMANIRDSMRLTQILIEHDMQFVSTVCSHLLALDFGRVLTSGPIQTVLSDERVVESYLGKPHVTGDEASASSNSADVEDQGGSELSERP
jgi:branched-chain amino acid transport system ATP-binding protein